MGSIKQPAVAPDRTLTMNFGGQAGAGARHRLGGLTAGGVGSVGMHPHRGAINHHGFVVPIYTAEGAPYCRPQTRFGPSAKPIIHGLPSPEHLRQIAPWRAGAQYPQDRFDPQPHVPACPAAPLGPAQAVPMGFNFFSSSQSPSARTNLDCWFTTRSKYPIAQKSS